MPNPLLLKQLPDNVYEFVHQLVQDYNQVAKHLARKSKVPNTYLIDMYSRLDQIEIKVSASKLPNKDKIKAIEEIKTIRVKIYCEHYQPLLSPDEPVMQYLEFRIAGRSAVSVPEQDPAIYSSELFALPKAGALISAAESISNASKGSSNPLRTSSSGSALSTSGRKSKSQNQSQKISSGSYNIFVSTQSKHGSEADLSKMEKDYDPSWSVAEFEARMQAISELEAIILNKNLDDLDERIEMINTINDEITRQYRMLDRLLEDKDNRQLLLHYLEAGCIELALSNIPQAVFLRDGSVNAIGQVNAMRKAIGHPKKMREANFDFLSKELREKIKATDKNAVDEFLKSLSDEEQISIRWGASVRAAEKALTLELNKMMQFKRCDVRGILTGNNSLFFVSQPNGQVYVIRMLAVQDNLYNDGIDCSHVRQVIFNSPARKYMAKNYGQHTLGKDRDYGVVNIMQITEFFPSDLERYAQALRTNEEVSFEDKSEQYIQIGISLLKMHMSLHKYGVCFPDSKASNIMLRVESEPKSMVISDIKTMVMFPLSGELKGMLHNDQVTFTSIYENKYVREHRGLYDVLMGARVTIAASLYIMATGHIPDMTKVVPNGPMHLFDFTQPIFKGEAGKKLRDLIAALSDPSLAHDATNKFHYIARKDTSFAAIVDAIEVELMASPRGSLVAPPALPPSSSTVRKT